MAGGEFCWDGRKLDCLLDCRATCAPPSRYRQKYVEGRAGESKPNEGVS